MPTGSANRNQQQQRVAEMLRHLGLASNGPPLAGAPGSILRRPASSPRYEADLGQLQRATRAEARSQAPGAGTFADLKPNTPKTDGPVSLPRLVYKDDEVRNAQMRREAAASSKKRGFDFATEGRMSAELAERKKSEAERQTSDGWRKHERAVYEHLMPDNAISDVAGKLWALPLTAAGAVAGSLNVAAARLAGNRDARISLANNAIQFENGLFGKSQSAFTLGNSVLYGPGAYPSLAIDERYDRRKTPVTLGDHEKGHTYQFTKPLFPALYVGSKIADEINGKYHRYEVEADDFSEDAYRRRK